MGRGICRRSWSAWTGLASEQRWRSMMLKVVVQSGRRRRKMSAKRAKADLEGREERSGWSVAVGMGKESDLRRE